MSQVTPQLPNAQQPQVVVMAQQPAAATGPAVDSRKLFGAMALCLLIDVIALFSPILNVKMSIFGTSINHNVKMLDAKDVGTITMLLLIVSIIVLIITLLTNAVSKKYDPRADKCAVKSHAIVAILNLLAFIFALLYLNKFTSVSGIVEYSLGLGAILCIIGALANIALAGLIGRVQLL